MCLAILGCAQLWGIPSKGVGPLRAPHTAPGSAVPGSHSSPHLSPVVPRMLACLVHDGRVAWDVQVRVHYVSQRQLLEHAVQAQLFQTSRTDLWCW